MAFFYSFMFLFCFASSYLFAQSQLDESSVGKKDLKEDIYLSNFKFSKKYLNKFKTMTAKDLYFSYNFFSDVSKKVLVLNSASKDVIVDPIIVNLFRDILLDVYGISASGNEKSSLSKIKLVVSHIISQNWESFKPESIKILFYALFNAMYYDYGERCNIGYVFALANLFSKGNLVEGLSDKIINKNYIVGVLNNRLDKVSRYSKLLAWSLVKALGILKDKSSIPFLLRARYRSASNLKIMYEINKSLNLIMS